MSAPKVIVFGPTGAVGSSAARTAAAAGAHVVLAMRDTSKSIRGLSADEESLSGQYTRVQADLLDPASISSAIASSGATRAFFYLAYGSSDSMRGTIEAMKASGIELPVFLSSYTIRSDIDKKDIPQSDIIPFAHAQVELVLDEIYGADAYVALRPGSFASNMFYYKPQIQSGTLRVVNPDLVVDHIVPEDIGRVGGTVLAKGPPADGEKKLYLFGPERTTLGESSKKLGKLLGKETSVEKVDDATAMKLYTDNHLPEMLAKYMVEKSKINGTGLHVMGVPIPEGSEKNVQKYSGQKSTTYDEWLEATKSQLAA